MGMCLEAPLPLSFKWQTACSRASVLLLLPEMFYANTGSTCWMSLRLGAAQLEQPVLAQSPRSEGHTLLSLRFYGGAGGGVGD